MLVCWPIAVNDDHLPTLGKCRPQAPQECIRLTYLVVHVDHENPVEAVFRKPRVIKGPFLYRDIIQSLSADALPKAVKRTSVYVLGKNPAFGAHPFGKPYCIISLARADICNRGPWLDTGPIHYEFGLARFVTRGLGRILGVAGLRHWSIGAGKLPRTFQSLGLRFCGFTGIEGNCAQ